MKTPLYIKVHPVLKEFYKCLTGSDVIEVKPNDDFSTRIKTILQLTPKNYNVRYPFGREDYITLLLPGKFYLGRDKYIDTTSRNYLDDRRQYFISQELYGMFKSIFHNYVLAYTRSGRQQKEGILDFCEVYNISMDKINFDMLKKSWDRSFEKKIYKKSITDTVP